MKTKTLIYINELLEHNLEVRRKSMKMLNDAQRKAEKENANNVECLKRELEKSKEAYFEAVEVLDDFQNNDWR